MKTEIEMELCSICLYQDDLIRTGGHQYRCGSKMNEHCPGFKPIRTGMEGRR